ncbi:hypothetical protein AALK94_12475 [Bacteroides faecichinchillae]|jgi:hypothetical protein|uniref:Uncharacterized protein n=1 Tax=Bacteroides faecichinchillae TaxID=871325 RepID=A0A1M5BL10_9BACE|nr:hypothetical protein [Bacteroides faecichinchillae]SHF43085.1 hypothetical protein SAMN05444349_11949 [Bacteroides faecichinchillae]
MDKGIPYACKDENKGVCNNEIFLQESNTLLTKVIAIPISGDDVLWFGFLCFLFK